METLAYQSRQVLKESLQVAAARPQLKGCRFGPEESATLFPRNYVICPTNGDGWMTHDDYQSENNRESESADWMSLNHECDWTGVSCNGDKVTTSLLLYDRAISGTIPSEISLLSSLSGLELTNTFLTGAIPTELGLLAKLQRLSLEHNRLTDTIPSVLGQLGLIVVGVVPRK
jgi:hypothetical protein